MYAHPVPSLNCAVSLPDSPWAYIRDFGHVLLTLGGTPEQPASWRKVNFDLTSAHFDRASGWAASWAENSGGLV
jgi:hypothetical protein